jgi:hypothetical protein
MSIRKTLSKLLAPPSKIAHNLDWRKVSGSILSLHIGRDMISLAVASHPAFNEDVENLPSINVKMTVKDNCKVLDKSTVEQLTSVVQDRNVCGLVISWPVQKEGWCGAPCGRVLHTLDQITAQSNNIINPSRPACLWDGEHRESAEDAWGRMALYSQTSVKTLHLASEEQYRDHDTLAADVWNDFCRNHWPELYQEQAASMEDYMAAPGKQPAPLVDLAWLDDCEDASAYTKATL